MESKNESMFLVDYDRMLQYPNIPTYIKSAIYQGKLNGYLPFEKFLRELSTDDLINIQVIFDKARDNDEVYVGLSFAIAATLAQLEGVFIESNKDLQDFWGTTLIGINLESLSRKGLVELNRTNLNFIATDEEVVRITDSGRGIVNKSKGTPDV